MKAADLRGSTQIKKEPSRTAWITWPIFWNVQRNGIVLALSSLASRAIAISQVCHGGLSLRFKNTCERLT